MSNYENGAFTRRAIVDACKVLFYEKGYHETSYADICEMAHVNRGTIYYHFPNKEQIRFEAHWELFTECKHIAEAYCPDSRYYGIIAMALFWQRNNKDDKMRFYTNSIYQDYPIYTGKKDISYFYYAVYDYMWSHFLEKVKISPMAFSTVYGYVASCTLLMCEYPQRYDSWELYEHCCRSSLRIWGAEEGLIDEIFTNAKTYFDALPEDAWKRPVCV